MSVLSAGMITADSPADLASTHVSEIRDGTIGFVVSSSKLYLLLKNTSNALAVPSDGIVPAGGAAIAGSPHAFWNPLASASRGVSAETVNAASVVLASVVVPPKTGMKIGVGVDTRDGTTFAVGYFGRLIRCYADATSIVSLQESDTETTLTPGSTATSSVLASFVGFTVYVTATGAVGAHLRWRTRTEQLEYGPLT